jgi:hypothetical protein
MFHSGVRTNKIGISVAPFWIKLACALKKLAVGELKQRGFAMPGDVFDDAKQLSPASPSDVLARANKVIKDAPG